MVRGFLLVLMMVPGLASANASPECDQLSQNIKTFRASMEPVYTELNRFVGALGGKLLTWHGQLAQLEGKSIEVKKGTFEFVRVAAESIDASAQLIGEKAEKLEDDFVPLLDNVENCRSELFEEMSQIELDLGDHIIESKDFVLSIAGLMFEWHQSWVEFEDTSQEITFPKGMFEKVLTASDKVNLGYRYIVENSQYVLKSVDAIIGKVDGQKPVSVVAPSPIAK